MVTLYLNFDCPMPANYCLILRIIRVFVCVNEYVFLMHLKLRSQDCRKDIQI